MKGRKLTPTNLRLLHGNPGKRRLPKGAIPSGEFGMTPSSRTRIKVN